MIVSILFITTLFLFSFFLIVVAAKAHMVLIETLRRNEKYMKKTIELSAKCEDDLVEFHIRSRSLNMLFDQIDRSCREDPNCKLKKHHEKGGRK